LDLLSSGSPILRIPIWRQLGTRFLLKHDQRSWSSTRPMVPNLPWDFGVSNVERNLSSGLPISRIPIFWYDDSWTHNRTFLLIRILDFAVTKCNCFLSSGFAKRQTSPSRIFATRPKWIYSPDQILDFAKCKVKNTHLCESWCSDLRNWMIARHASFLRSIVVILSLFWDSKGLEILVSRLSRCRWLLIYATCLNWWAVMIGFGVFSVDLSDLLSIGNRYPDAFQDSLCLWEFNPRATLVRSYS